MPMSAKDKKEIMRFEEEQKREWNKIIIAHIRKIEQIKKPSVQFPNTIKQACEEYLNLCQSDGVKPSVAGLSVALGTNRCTLLQWVRGEISVESADVIQYYFNLLEIFDETAIKDNRTNAVAGIFYGKNNYGYRDEVEHKIVIDKEISNEEIENRYRKMHEIVNEKPKEIEIIEAEVSIPKPKDKVKEEVVINNDDEVPF